MDNVVYHMVPHLVQHLLADRVAETLALAIVDPAVDHPIERRGLDPDLDRPRLVHAVFEITRLRMSR